MAFYRREEEERRPWLQAMQVARQKRARRAARHDGLAQLASPLSPDTPPKQK